GRRETARHQCAAWRRDQHRGQKRGDGIGYSGHKHQKGEKVIAIIDNHGYVLAPVPVAPVNETDMVLLPEGLRALKKVAKEVSLDFRGAYFNLDGGFDSTRNRKCIFNAGLTPNIPENPRNRTDSTELRGGGHPRSAKTARSEDLQVEEPVSCWDCSSLHFHPTLATMLGATLI